MSNREITIQPYSYYGAGFIVAVDGIVVRIGGVVIFPSREAAEAAAQTITS